jgi:hypothetical protein
MTLEKLSAPGTNGGVPAPDSGKGLARATELTTTDSVGTQQPVEQMELLESANGQEVAAAGGSEKDASYWEVWCSRTLATLP